jgi:hypothetical protein
MFTDELTKVRVEVWQFGCGGGVVGVGGVSYRPCSEAANRRISFCKRDAREDVPVDNPPCTRIFGVVMGDSGVGFDLTDMSREAYLFSSLYVVVGFYKEIKVWVVLVVEWVDDAISDRVDAKDVVGQDAELGSIVIEL